MIKDDSNFKSMIAVLIFLVFSFFVMGPLSIYLSNAEELAFGLKDVLLNTIPISLLVLILGTIIYFLIPKRFKEVYILICFIIALVFYIQGNYLSNFFSTGVLNGTTIDWEEQRTPAMINIGIYALLILIILVSKSYLKKFINYIAIASLFFTAIQIPALIVQTLNYSPKTEQALMIHKDEEFDFSKDENVIFIILDAMDEDFYSEFINNNEEAKSELEGFVHYDNMMTGGARTMIAMPIYYSGQPFVIDKTYTTYLQNIYDGNNVLSYMNDAGFENKIFSERLYFSSSAAKHVKNFSLTNQSLGINKKLIKKLYKVTAYKYLPIVFKPFFFFDTSEFNEIVETSETYSCNDVRFLEDLNEKGVRNTASKKVFVTYHLNGAHSPYTIGADGKKSSEATLQTQVEGVFSTTFKLLSELKKNGVYDNSTIIITADHGDLNYAQHPILLIKEKDSKSEYSTSHKPVSAFDIPVYFSKLANATLNNNIYGLNLEEIKEDDIRERHLFYNQTESSNIIINEYVTSSNAGDVESIKLVHTYEDVLSSDTPYKLGTTLSFEADATGNIYCTSGFSTNTGFRTMLRGPVSEMEIPFEEIPTKNEISAYIKLHNKSSKNLKLIIEANGTEVYNNTVDSSIIKSGISFVIPANCFDENILKLKFIFPDVDSNEMNESTGKRTETISFVSLSFE